MPNTDTHHSAIDQITVRELVFDCIIGILPAERIVPQPLSINLDLGVNITPSSVDEDISLTVDYAKVCESLAAFAQQHKFLLVETLACKAIEHLFNLFPLIAKISISIEKPQAIENVKSVGVKVFRTRP